MKTSRFASLAACFSLLCGVGCATQADLQAVQNERNALRTQMADTNASLNNLRSEIEQVRGEVESVRHRLDRVAQQSGGTSPQMRRLEQRIAELEKQVAPRGYEPTLPDPFRVPGPGVGSTPAPVPAPTAPPPSISPEPQEAQNEYALALRALRAQQYDSAIQEFRDFQRKHPDSAMADDAQYWIGESYFVQRDYNRAILEFNDVVLKYRRGDRVPAALLRQAQAFLEIGDQTDARLILQKLIADHPRSESAAEARELLRTLGS